MEALFLLRFLRGLHPGHPRRTDTFKGIPFALSKTNQLVNTSISEIRIDHSNDYDDQKLKYSMRIFAFFVNLFPSIIGISQM